MSLLITFDLEGNGRCLYSELIDLTALGHIQVRRASHIEFNEERQRWEVTDLLGRLRFFSKSRAVCLAWERENL